MPFQFAGMQPLTGPLVIFTVGDCFLLVQKYHRLIFFLHVYKKLS